MRHQVFLLICSAGLFSCNNDNVHLTIQSNGQIVVVDSSGQSENLWTYQPNERSGYYPIYYIGKLEDTIRLGQEKIPGRSKGQKDYSKFKNFSNADSLKMRIIVDTAFSLTHTFYTTHYDEKENKKIIDSKESFNSFAIFVYNLSDSLFSVGTFSELCYTIRQAKDELGNWRDIEIPYRSFCATGARDIVIEPHQFLVAKLIRYKGDFKTACRLKFKRGIWTVYSNTFTDFIDKKQLTDTF